MDTARPDAQAIAVKGNKVIAVGSDADIKRLIGPQTKQIDGAAG
jgi:predicted amidohydrolase YtcJ